MRCCRAILRPWRCFLVSFPSAPAKPDNPGNPHPTTRKIASSTHNLLANRTIIVTGAASGTGQAFAFGCAAQGANLVVVDIGLVDETMAAIAAAGGQALYARADVSDDTSARQMAAQVVSRFGRIGGASTTPPTSAKSNSPASSRSTLASGTASFTSA